MINRTFSDYAIKRIQLAPSTNLSPKPILTAENSTYVFPFDLISGYINSTDAGLSNDNFLIDSFSTYERIYTGVDNIIARWEGSTRCYLANPTDNFLTKEFKVGKSLRAVIRQKKSRNEFATSADGFASQREIKTYDATIYDEFTDADQFKLFVVPQLEGYQWLEPSEITNYYTANGAFYKCELQLNSLGDKVAKSGRALQEFVLYGAPGDGYAFPMVLDDDSVVLDPVRQCDVPITGFQIELMGASAFISAEIYGRPTINKTENGITTSVFNPRIEAPRRLLTKSILTPRPSATNTKPSYNTDLFFLSNIQPTLELYWDNWKTRFQSSYDRNIEATYEGVIEADTLEKVRATNPFDPAFGGKRKFAMNDPAWTMPTQSMVFDTRYSGLTEKPTLTLPATASMAEILNHLSFGLQAITTLPMNITDNLVVRTSDIPIIGGFITRFLLGVDPGWTSSSYLFNLIRSAAFVSTDIVEYGHKQLGSSDASKSVLLPFDIFQNADNPFQKNAGISSKSLIVAFDLTDTFVRGTEKFNTITLGQSGGSKWDGDAVPATRQGIGFVIDATIVKTLGKCQARITYFSNDISVWSGVYQTQSLYTGNVRDITTAIKHSSWSVDEANALIGYPAVIVAPTPPSQSLADYDIGAFKDAKVVLDANNYTLSIRERWNEGTNNNAVGFFLNRRYMAVDPGGKGLVVFSPNSAYPNTATPQNYSDTLAIIKSYRFDTAPLGGFTRFRNSYSTIELSLYNGGRISIDIDDLSKAGSIVRDVPISLPTGSVNIGLTYGSNYQVSNYVLSNAKKPVATFRQDGDAIVLDLSIENTWTWNRYDSVAIRDIMGTKVRTIFQINGNGDTGYYQQNVSYTIAKGVAKRRAI